MKTKRPYTRAEKTLFFAPLLFVLAAGGALWAQSRQPIVLMVKGASDIRSVAWSPDGKRLALFAQFTGPYRFGARPVQRVQGMVYDVATRAKVCDLKSPPLAAGKKLWFSRPSWSPDGRQIATGFGDGSLGTSTITIGKSTSTNTVGKIAVWDARNGNLKGNYLYAPPTESSSAGVYFSRDGKQLIGYERPPAVFDAQSGARLRRFGSPLVREGRFNVARSMVALSSYGNPRFEVRDIRSGKVLWQPRGKIVGNAQWRGSDVLGAIEYVGDKQKKLLLWDAKTRRALTSPQLKNVFDFAFSSRAPLVAVVELDSTRPETNYFAATVVMWNYQLNRIVWKRRMDGVDSISYSRDGKWLAVHAFNSKENGVQIFDASGQVRMRRDFKKLWSFNWAPDSKRLAVYGGDKIEIVRVA